tara:strand:- start:2868 stop:3737 length:870 start_codon:yes stop_codon:yes gene_type:complete
MPYSHINEEKALSNRQHQASIDSLQSLNTGSFFISWLRKGVDSIWASSFVRYVNAPLAVVTSIFMAILAWRKVHLSRGQDKHAIANAIVETLAGGAMIAAAVGVVVAAAMFAYVAPILIASALAAKVIFSVGSAIYFGVKARSAEGSAKDEYKKRVKDALVEALVGGVVAAAAVTLMLVAAPIVQSVVAGIALAAGITGFMYSLFKSGTMGERKNLVPASAAELEKFSSDHRISSRLGYELSPVTRAQEVSRDSDSENDSVTDFSEHEEVETDLLLAPDSSEQISLRKP